MKFLAMDTVFDQCSVAIIDSDQRILADATILGKRQQSQQILPMIDSLLTQAHLQLSDLCAIIFNQGPGAFSGIRINTAVTQALAVSHDLPCVGVSSLQAIAQSAFEQFGQTHLYSALDARMQQVYFGEYQLDAPSQLMAPVIKNEVAKSDHETNRQANQNSPKTNQKNNPELFNTHQETLLDYNLQTPLNLPICGNGAPFLALQPNQPTFEQISPDATVLARLGLAQFLAKGGVEAAFALPNYLRNQAWKTLKEQGKS